MLGDSLIVRPACLPRGPRTPWTVLSQIQAHLTESDPRLPGTRLAHPSASYGTSIR